MTGLRRRLYLPSLLGGHFGNWVGLYVVLIRPLDLLWYGFRIFDCSF
jgi:hypothetical protein